jgi:alkanesulfonate monooxygenase
MTACTGVDFSRYGFDGPIRHSRAGAQNSALDGLTIADPDRVWTMREIAKHAALGGRGPGGGRLPEQVADELIA